MTEILQDTFLENDHVASVKACIVALTPALQGGDVTTSPLEVKRARKLLALAFDTVESGSLDSQLQEELQCKLLESLSSHLPFLLHVYTITTITHFFPPLPTLVISIVSAALSVVATVFVGFYELIACAARVRVADKQLTEDVKKMLLPAEIQTVSPPRNPMFDIRSEKAQVTRDIFS